MPVPKNLLIDDAGASAGCLVGFSSISPGFTEDEADGVEP